MLCYSSPLATHLAIPTSSAMATIHTRVYTCIHATILYLGILPPYTTPLHATHATLHHVPSQLPSLHDTTHTQLVYYSTQIATLLCTYHYKQYYVYICTYVSTTTHTQLHYWVSQIAVPLYSGTTHYPQYYYQICTYHTLLLCTSVPSYVYMQQQWAVHQIGQCSSYHTITTRQCGQAGTAQQPTCLYHPVPSLMVPCYTYIPQYTGIPSIVQYTIYSNMVGSILCTTMHDYLVGVHGQ